MKKILIVSQYYKPEPFLINEVIETLNEKGYELTVLTGLPNYPEGEIYKGYEPGVTYENGVEVVRVNARPRKNGKLNLFLNYFSFALKGSIKALKLKGKYDVVYVYQLSPVFMAIPALIYKLKYKRKILLYCLDLWPQSLIAGGVKNKSLIYNFFLVICKLIYKNVDKIQISSSLFEKYFKEELKIIKKLSYSPQYANDLFLNNDIYNEVNINHEKINIMFAGNLGEVQSIETIIKAVHIANNSRLHFHIVGDGSNKENLLKLVSELNIEDKITFHGRKPIEMMPTYYSNADGLIVSLKKDDIISYTLPGKVQTYMASRKPIIGSIDGEAAEVIEKSKCGLVSPAEDVQKLSESLNEFCSMNSEERKKLGDNGYNYYKQNFTKKIFMDNLIKDMEEISKWNY